VSISDSLRIVSVNLDCPPLAMRERGGRRLGYEPAMMEHVAERLGRPIEWVFRPWAELVPTLLDGGGDAVCSGQGINAARSKVVDFTHPYAIFDETVLVREGAGVGGLGDLDGMRVGAIAESTNMALAETFPGAIRVPFDGSGEDVFGEMIEALRRGDVDAIVDDDVVTIPVGDEPEFEVAFTVASQNRWGISVSKDSPALRDQLSGAIRAAIEDGALARIWEQWIEDLPFPRGLTHGI
jgi:polar amino acid transport system substrate-binding protein